jgi:hypothetical protein
LFYTCVIISNLEWTGVVERRIAGGEWWNGGMVEEI